MAMPALLMASSESSSRLGSYTSLIVVLTLKREEEMSTELIVELVACLVPILLAVLGVKQVQVRKVCKRVAQLEKLVSLINSVTRDGVVTQKESKGIVQLVAGMIKNELRGGACIPEIDRLTVSEIKVPSGYLKAALKAAEKAKKGG